jgi:predicted MPP superfamily phosphohydrolase
VIGINRIRIERREFFDPNMGRILDRVKCLQLSDLHIKAFGRRERRVVQLVERERPDVIFITGDMLVNYADDFTGCLETLKKLSAGSGIYAVFGNAEHTLSSARLLADFEKALTEIGITVLNNKSVTVGFTGKTLFLVGVDDPFFLFDDFDRAVNDVPAGAAAILLAHSPDILFPRSDALVVNLLDSPSQKDHSKEWGWEDSTRFGPDDGTVGFASDGRQVIRVQSRQDGVSLDTILLCPDERLNDALRRRMAADIDRMLTSEDRQKTHPDLIMIPASAVDSARIYGKWKRKRDPSALSGFCLTDLPPQQVWHYQPLIQPEHYFEAEFSARKDVRYRVWIRLKAYRGDPLHDSVYVQFNDSVDRGGSPRYRIGRPAQAKARLGEMAVILTGHTHGGQVRFPFLGPHTTMTAVGKKYLAGPYQVGASLLYVSRGIGWSAYPVRLFCPPEITVFGFDGGAPDPGG